MTWKFDLWPSWTLSGQWKSKIFYRWLTTQNKLLTFWVIVHMFTYHYRMMSLIVLFTDYIFLFHPTWQTSNSLNRRNWWSKLEQDMEINSLPRATLREFRPKPSNKRSWILLKWLLSHRTPNQYIFLLPRSQNQLLQRKWKPWWVMSVKSTW